MDISPPRGALHHGDVNENSTAKTAGPTPTPRRPAPQTRSEREAAVRLVRRERRRIEQRRDGRFDYLKRTYD
jgi:hypothetical protein